MAKKKVVLWKRDDLQFVRLLAELNAVGILPQQMDQLTESMDLPAGDIEELLERAEVKWEKIKRRILPV